MRKLKNSSKDELKFKEILYKQGYENAFKRASVYYELVKKFESKTKKILYLNNIIEEINNILKNYNKINFYQNFVNLIVIYTELWSLTQEKKYLDIAIEKIDQYIKKRNNNISKAYELLFFVCSKKGNHEETLEKLNEAIEKKVENYLEFKMRVIAYKFNNKLYKKHDYTEELEVLEEYKNQYGEDYDYLNFKLLIYSLETKKIPKEKYVEILRKLKVTEISDVNYLENIVYILHQKGLLYLIIEENIIESDEEVSSLLEFVSDEMSEVKITSQSISHYTSIEALKGILEMKQFFATKYDFLNDDLEHSYSKSWFQDDFESKDKEQEEKEHYDILKRKIKLDGDSEKILFFNEICNEIVPLYSAEMKKYFFDNAYVLSFSKNHDSLTLWGNYSEFTGYSIKFDLNKIIDDVNKNTPDYLINRRILQDSEKVGEFLHLGENPVEKSILGCYFGEISYDSEKTSNNFKKIIDKAYRKFSPVLKD